MLIAVAVRCSSASWCWGLRRTTGRFPPVLLSAGSELRPRARPRSGETCDSICCEQSTPRSTSFSNSCPRSTGPGCAPPIVASKALRRRHPADFAPELVHIRVSEPSRCQGPPLCCGSTRSTGRSTAAVRVPAGRRSAGSRTPPRQRASYVWQCRLHAVNWRDADLPRRFNAKRSATSHWIAEARTSIGRDAKAGSLTGPACSLVATAPAFSSPAAIARRPAGIGISVVREPNEMARAPRSLYLLLDQPALADFKIPFRREEIARLPYGTLYRNLDSGCP